MKQYQIIGLLAVCFALLTPTTHAQGDYRFGGLTMNRDLMMAWDFSDLSHTQTFGTARSMAMGGAFTSLGADLSTMAQNPAGLGMFRHSEVSVTPLLSVARATNEGVDPWGGNGKNRFALSNFGVAMNLYENGSSAITSVTFGFGMNRIADFNTRYSFSVEDPYSAGMGRVPSIADVFVHQLQFGAGGSPILPQPGAGAHNPNGQMDFRDPYFWPAILAYKSAMIHVDPSNPTRWGRDAIGDQASILRSTDVVSSGSINEFDLSVGANINNIVYIGATVGVQSVSRNLEVRYGEDYGYFNDPDRRARNARGELLPAQLDYADLHQRIEMRGSGVNFKLGVIVRPTEGLRFGVAFHTPTYYSIDRAYQAGVGYNLQDHTTQRAIEEFISSPVQYDEAGDSWDFISPSRLLLGASYTLGRWAILSVDYERAWYNGIRVKNVPGGVDFAPIDYKYDVKTNFTATNAVRAGLEFRPLPILALRAGGGYTSSMLKDQSLAYEVPQKTDSWYFTAGVGVRFGKRFTLDAAYQQLTENQSQYSLFYEFDRTTGEFGVDSGLFKTNMKRHFASLTFGVKF